MVVQYPDTATIQGKAPEATEVGGVWVAGDQPSDITQLGRYEPSTLNRTQALKDGSEVKLKGVFYTNLTCPDVDEGMDITVTNRVEEIVLQTKVLFFSRGQLGCRIFL